MSPLEFCVYGFIAFSFACTMLFWAAAVLASRDDAEHGRDCEEAQERT